MEQQFIGGHCPDFNVGYGSFGSVLKRIGSNKSTLLCVGQDPLTLSGAIVANGKLVSSKILDITVTPAEKEYVSTDKDKYLNKVTIKYIDSIDKKVRKLTFDILNEEALYMLINNCLNINGISQKQYEIDEKVAKIDEKVTKNDDFLAKINFKIGTIEDDVNSILDNDVTSLEYNENMVSDFNDLIFQHTENGIEKEEKIDILDKKKFREFKKEVFLKLNEIENKVNSLMYYNNLLILLKNIEKD